LAEKFEEFSVVSREAYCVLGRTLMKFLICVRDFG